MSALLMMGAVVMATITGFAVLTFNQRSGGGGERCASGVCHRSAWARTHVGEHDRALDRRQPHAARLHRRFAGDFREFLHVLVVAPANHCPAGSCQHDDFVDADLGERRTQGLVPVLALQDLLDAEEL